MEIQNLTTKIIFLFIPGIISVLLIQKTTSTVEKEPIMIILKCIAYGIFSYFTLYVIYWIHNAVTNRNILTLNFFETLNNSDFSIKDIKEVFYVSIVAYINSHIYAIYTNIVYENNNFNHELQKVKKKELTYNPKKNLKLLDYINIFSVNFITPVVLFIDSLLKVLRTKRNHLPNTNIWDYVLTNYDSPIIVRDWDNMRAYYGEVNSASFSSNGGELFLKNVTIIDQKNNTSRYVSSIYLSKSDISSWDIEFPTYFKEEKSLKTNLVNKKFTGKNTKVINKLTNSCNKSTNSKVIDEINKLYKKAKKSNKKVK